jgi:monoamine oxidase
MTITRRAFVSASAAFAFAPAFSGRIAAAPLPRDADIVVIGAGAAGIAAARRIAAANRKVVVIEAADRIGGRCQTDTTTFDMPFDRGAQWMHGPDTNPLLRLARGTGLEIFPAPPGQKIRIGRRNARAGETEDFLATLVRANRAIDDLAHKADMSCATALPQDLGDWGATLEFLLGAYASGKDLKNLSAVDQARAQDRSAAAGCRQGLGTLIGKLGDGLPIALATPATRITWGGRDVAVETPAGRVSARAAIVTASTNVLAAGLIKFAPDLPKRQLDAAAKLSLGSIDRIAVQLPGNPLELARDEVIIEQSNGPRTAALLAHVGASTLCSIAVGGAFGSDLSAQGEAAMGAFAVEWLAKLFGSDVAAAAKRTSATRWNAAPFVLGAMSAAAPGGQGSRRVLSEPVGNVFLAGEATHESLWGTIDGAWESGERAADAALQRIGGVSEPAPARKPAQRQRSPGGSLRGR